MPRLTAPFLSFFLSPLLLLSILLCSLSSSSSPLSLTLVFKMLKFILHCRNRKSFPLRIHHVQAVVKQLQTLAMRLNPGNGVCWKSHHFLCQLPWVNNAVLQSDPFFVLALCYESNQKIIPQLFSSAATVVCSLSSYKTKT